MFMLWQKIQGYVIGVLVLALVVIAVLFWLRGDELEELEAEHAQTVVELESTQANLITSEFNSTRMLADKDRLIGTLTAQGINDAMRADELQSLLKDIDNGPTLLAPLCAASPPVGTVLERLRNKSP